MTDRRIFLHRAAASPRDRRPLIIDALGGIDNMNLPSSRREDVANDFGIDTRSMSDAKASGLTAFNMTIGYVFGDADPYEKSLADVRAWNDYVRRVEVFANDGGRIIQLTYNAPNQLGDGGMVPANRGLTPFGHDVVDLSHSGEQICLDATAASKAPVMITHTGCRAVTDLPRNKSDKELRRVADQGGFVGIYFMPFLATGRRPTAEDLIRHIEHAIDICGEDHVGIGTDGSVTQIDHMADYLKELEDEVRQRRAAGISAPGERPDIVPFLPDLMGVDKFRRLADLLARRGHNSGRIEKILGTNFLRVADSVWA